MKLTFSIGDYPKATETIIAGGAHNFPGFVLINAPKQAAALFAADPDTRLIVRSTNADDVLKGSERLDQREVADHWWDVIEPFLAEHPPGILYLTVGHEPGVSNLEECQRFNEFLLAALEKIQTYNHRHLDRDLYPVVGNFSQGTPPLRKWDGFNGFEPLAPALRMAREMGGTLGLHQYWIERIWSDITQHWEVSVADPYHAFRHIEALAESASIPAQMMVDITEFGYAPGDPQGWLGQLEPDTYADALITANKIFELEPRIRLAAIFHWAGEHWPLFSPEGMVAERVIAYARQSPPTGPKPPAPAGWDRLPTPPVPAPAPASQQIITTRMDGQRLRAGPGLGYDIVDNLRAGEPLSLTVEGRKNIGQDYSWAYVKTPRGTEGWAAAWLLKIITQRG